MKLLMKIISESTLIYITTIIIAGFLSLFFNVGPESTMEGWAEITIASIFTSCLAIFLFDKEVKIKHKFYGTFSVTLISIGISFLLFHSIEKDIGIYVLAIGYPLFLIIGKIFYKKFIITKTASTLTNK